MAFEPGQRAGDYEILDVIGKGGMGCVYRVRNVLSNRIEAMKVLLSNFTSEPQLGERFLAEIRTVARLDHPNIARLHTAFQVENQLVMVMEFIEGIPLSEASKKEPLPLDAIFSYSEQILSALAYAHRSGVVHRDIKPSNVMVTPSGLAKLMDFGIAKSAADPMRTSPGTTMGSIMYMSPEQVRGAEVDARSDLYSFGILLYELTAGQCPFQSETMFAILDAHLNTIPKPPLALNPSLPPALSELILTALQKDPSKRFANADAFRNALVSVRQQLGATEPEYAPTVVEMPAVAPATPKASASSTDPARVSAVQPIAPAPSVPVPSVLSAAPAKSGSRTLWMAAGALACVCILIAAAVALPHFFNPSAASSLTKQKPTVTETQPPSSFGQRPEGAKAESSKDTATPASQANQGAALPNTSPEGEKQSEKVSAAGPGRHIVRSSDAPASNETVRTADRKPAGPPPSAMGDAKQRAATPQNVPAQTTATANPAPPPAGPSQADLDRAEDDLIKLRARADAARASVENLRSQQAASGLGLRQDVSAAAKAMDSYLQASERAIQSGNLERAKKLLESADAEITKVESFFGR